MEPEAFDGLLNNFMVRTPKDEPPVDESTKKSTIQMKHIKAHLDVIAVGLIIVVSLYKIYDLSKK